MKKYTHTHRKGLPQTMIPVKISFEDKETTLVVDPSSTTVESLLGLLGKSLGVSMSSLTHSLFRESSGTRRTTVRLDVMDEKTLLSSLQLGAEEVLVCRGGGAGGGGGGGVLRVLVSFADKAVEMPLFDCACGAFVGLVLDKAGTKPHGKVLLVKFKPYDESDARHDDWEVLNETRRMSSYAFAGYSLLLCLEEDFQQNEGSVRVWLNLLLDWERHKKLLKSRLRAGVPGWVRGQIWALLLEAPSRRAEHPGLFSSLVAEAPVDASERWESDRRVIFRDVFRTFPTHPYFRLEEQTGQLALQHVLVAWHSMEPTTGYCQGINFIAAIFLLYQDEEIAFWSLHGLLKQRGLEHL